MAAIPVSGNQKAPGLSHWAAIGNLKTNEIKDRREAITSEKTLLSASSILQGSVHKVVTPKAFANTCAIA